MSENETSYENPYSATVRLTPETRRKLNVWKTERDLTYDEAVDELIDRAESADDEYVCEGCGDDFDTESALHGHETHCAEAST